MIGLEAFEKSFNELKSEQIQNLYFTKTTYRNILYSGLELEIVAEAEESGEMKIVNSKREQFINILVGKVTITPQKGESQTFHTGDFFILPKGFQEIGKASVRIYLEL